MTEPSAGRVSLIVTVDVDPVWHGHNIPVSEAEEIVVAAIEARRGLQVAESYSVVAP
jgi:hypothetical protein